MNEQAMDFDPQDVAENKVLAMISCMGILLLVGLFAKPDSKLVRYYVNQAILLTIVAIGVPLAAIILMIIIGLLAALFTPLLILMALVVFLIWAFEIAVFVAMIMNMVNAYNGKKSVIPVLKNITILK